MTAAEHPHAGLRAISAFKAFKSALALMIALWLCSIIGHGDVQDAALRFIGHLGLRENWHFTQYLTEKASSLTNQNAWPAVWLLLGYAVVHGAEAVGLWMERTWAEWFTLSSGAIYVPLEIKSMTHGFTSFNIGAFIVSLVITGYIGAVLYQKRKARRVKRQGLQVANQAIVQG